MIKGALILGAGFVAGYQVSLKNQEFNREVSDATVELLTSLKAIFNDAWLDAKNDMKSKEDVGQTGTNSVQYPRMQPAQYSAPTGPPKGETVND